MHSSSTDDDESSSSNDEPERAAKHRCANGSCRCDIREHCPFGALALHVDRPSRRCLRGELSAITTYDANEPAANAARRGATRGRGAGDTISTMRTCLVLGGLLVAACGPSVAHSDGSGSGGASDEGSSSASDDGGTEQDAPSQPDTIIDQSGAEFRWVCPPGEQCRIEIIAGLSPLPEHPRADPEWDGPCPDDWKYVRDDFDDHLRFFDVQGACVTATGWYSWRGEWGRYVICEQDTDCPQVVDPSSGTVTTSFSCVAGFCQDAVNFDLDEVPDGWTMRALCIGDGPRFVPDVYSVQALPYQAGLDAACSGPDAPCDYVPEGCHYPRD